jgi:hypothetical protein
MPAADASAVRSVLRHMIAMASSPLGSRRS